MAFGKVYCFGPTFRAEKSKTRRHLTEFWMVEPEVAFVDLDDDMDLAEDFLVHVVQRVLERRRRRARARSSATSAPLERVQKPFPRITYDEAIERAAAARASRSSGATTSAPTRRRRSRQQFDRPVMVHRYPAASKAFYMKADPADPRLALCVDVLAPEGYGEIIGGGQREDDLAVLEAQIARARAAARGVRLVPRPPPLRLGAARGLRHGHRARASPGSAGCTTCARRSRSRACSSACGREP